MRNAAQFFVLASWLTFVDGTLEFHTDPKPLVAGEKNYTVFFTRDSGDPSNFNNVDLLLGGTIIAQFALDFKGQKTLPPFHGESHSFIYTNPGSYSYLFTSKTLTTSLAFSVVPAALTTSGEPITSTSNTPSTTLVPTTPLDSSSSGVATTTTSAAVGSTSTSNSEISSLFSLTQLSSPPSGTSSVLSDPTAQTGTETFTSAPNVSMSGSPLSSSSHSPVAASGGISNKRHAGVIAGVVIGSLAAVGIIVVAIFFYKRSRRRSRHFSFNRDLMVRQRPRSVASVTATDAETAFDPYQVMEKEKPPIQEDAGVQPALGAYAS